MCTSERQVERKMWDKILKEERKKIHRLGGNFGHENVPSYLAVS